MSDPNAPRGDGPPQRDDFARDADRTREFREAMERHARNRNVPTSVDLARRRSLVALAKWALPVTAALLLGSIAAWPEIAHLISMNRAAVRELAHLRVESGNMEGAVYRGLDAHGRPYMITAQTTHQIGDDRFNLVKPVGDTVLSGGGWAEVRADHGVFMQHEQALDLSGHVVVYRDDGTIMSGPTADLDLRRGIIASNDWVHVEGPFGMLDAQGYFLDQRAGISQFTGPVRLIRNDDAATGGSADHTQAAQTPAGKGS